MENVFTDEQVMTLIMSLAQARGDKGFTEDEAQELVDWAVEVRINYELLGLILDGFIAVNWDSEHGEPAFKLTEKGIKERERLREKYGDDLIKVVDL